MCVKCGSRPTSDIPTSYPHLASASAQYRSRRFELSTSTATARSSDLGASNTFQLTSTPSTITPPPWGGAPTDHMTGRAAVDEDGMQWEECEFWVEGRPQLRAGEGEVTAAGGQWSRLAAGMVRDDAPSGYTRNWRHKRPLWAPSSGWDECTARRERVLI